MRPVCHMSILSAMEHYSTTGACHQEGIHPNSTTTRHSREKTPLTEFMVIKEVCLFAAGSNTFFTAAISTVNFIFGAQHSPCSLFKWLSTVPAQFSPHHLLSNTNDWWDKWNPNHATCVRLIKLGWEYLYIYTENVQHWTCLWTCIILTKYPSATFWCKIVFSLRFHVKATYITTLLTGFYCTYFWHRISTHQHHTLAVIPCRMCKAFADIWLLWPQEIHFPELSAMTFGNHESFSNTKGELIWETLFIREL